MEPAIAAKLKESIAIRVYAQREGWKPVAASVAQGVITIDATDNTPTTRYNVVLDFAERFREIGGGKVLMGEAWAPFYHQEGLDTHWEFSFEGKALVSVVRYVLRTGEPIDIPVRYLGLPKEEKAASAPTFAVAVRADYQLLNVYWKGLSQQAMRVCVEVKAVEADGVYTVETEELSARNSSVRIDKLAAGEYTVKVVALGVADTVVAESGEIAVSVPCK